MPPTGIIIAFLKCGNKLTSSPEAFAGVGHKCGHGKRSTSRQYVWSCDKLLLIICFRKEIHFLMTRAQSQYLFLNSSGLKFYLILMKPGTISRTCAHFSAFVDVVST